MVLVCETLFNSYKLEYVCYCMVAIISFNTRTGTNQRERERGGFALYPNLNVFLVKCEKLSNLNTQI